MSRFLDFVPVPSFNFFLRNVLVLPVSVGVVSAGSTGSTPMGFLVKEVVDMAKSWVGLGVLGARFISSVRVSSSVE